MKKKARVSVAPEQGDEPCSLPGRALHIALSTPPPNLMPPIFPPYFFCPEHILKFLSQQLPDSFNLWPQGRADVIFYFMFHFLIDSFIFVFYFWFYCTQVWLNFNFNLEHELLRSPVGRRSVDWPNPLCFSPGGRTQRIRSIDGFPTEEGSK